MTDIDYVRLLISDVTAPQHYTDAQIQGFLTLAGGSVFLAAAMALEAWAATYTDSATSEKIGDYSYSKKTADNKLALAARYREQDTDAPAMGWASFNLTDIEDED